MTSSLWTAEPKGGLGAPKWPVAFGCSVCFVGSVLNVTSKRPHVLNSGVSSPTLVTARAEALAASGEGPWLPPRVPR